jgi:hypothetical protein
MAVPGRDETLQDETYLPQAGSAEIIDFLDALQARVREATDRSLRPALATRSSRGTSSAASTHDAKRPESGKSRFTTHAARAAHCSPRSTFTRVSQWRFSGIAG